MRSALRLLRRSPAYRRLYLADAVSLIGDWFSLVAVSASALTAETGAAAALAATLAAHMLPQSLFAPFAGWLVDRLDKRRVLVIGALLEGAVTLAMWAALVGHAPALVAVLLAIRSAVSAAREPAAGAALPSIVPPADLVLANTLSAVTWSAMFAVGMGLGGLAAAISPGFALFADALTFLVAAALLARLPRLPSEAEPSGAGIGRVAHDLAKAARLSWSAPLRPSVHASAAASLAAGAGWVALHLRAQALPFAAGAAAAVGVLQALRGLSTALGPFLTNRFGGSAMGRAALPAAAAVSLGAVSLAGSSSFVGAALSSMVWGAGGGALWMIMTTEIQRRAPAAMRGRMLAFFGMGAALSMCAGAALVAALLAWTESLLGIVVLIALFALVLFAVLRRRRVPADDSVGASAL